MSTPKPDKSTPTTIRLTERDRRRAAVLAHSQGRTLSGLLVFLIRAGMDALERGLGRKERKS